MTGGRIAPSEAAGHQDRDSAVFQAAVTQGEAAALEAEARQAGGKRNDRLSAYAASMESRSPLPRSRSRPLFYTISALPVHSVLFPRRTGTFLQA